MTEPRFVEVAGQQAENDNAVPYQIPSVLQTIKARHQRGDDARAMVEELIDALATCTVGWGCDAVEVATLYLNECKRRRG